MARTGYRVLEKSCEGEGSGINPIDNHVAKMMIPRDD